MRNKAANIMKTYNFHQLQDVANKTGVKVLFSGLTAHLEDVTKWDISCLPCGPNGLFAYNTATEDGKCHFYYFIN